jgi:hypothetical protein
VANSRANARVAAYPRRVRCGHPERKRRELSAEPDNRGRDAEWTRVLPFFEEQGRCATGSDGTIRNTADVHGGVSRAPDDRGDAFNRDRQRHLPVGGHRMAEAHALIGLATVAVLEMLTMHPGPRAWLVFVIIGGMGLLGVGPGGTTAAPDGRALS